MSFEIAGSVFECRMQDTLWQYSVNWPVATDSYTLCPEKGTTIFLPITLPNADRFSKLFDQQT